LNHIAITFYELFGGVMLYKNLSTCFKNIQYLAVFILFLLSANLTFSQETKETHQQIRDEELTKAAQNPIANILSFPFQNNTNFNILSGNL